MISNFGSFVGFFAAIYVTMAVNNDFCSNFWTPKYYKEMDLLLKRYDFSGSSVVLNRLMEEIKYKYETVQNRARYRGFVVLILCIYYLIFMGFENERNCLSVQHYVPILTCTILVALTIIFSKQFLRNWRCTIACVVLYASIYIILKVAQFGIFENNELFILAFNNKCHILVAIIILPVIHQLYLYWIYSSIYKSYLQHHVAIEYNRFKNAMEGIRNRDKSLVDDIYMAAWIETKFRTNEDPTLTTFYIVLNKQLLSIASPTHWQLLISWLKKHIQRICNKKENKDYDNDYNIQVDNDNTLMQYESDNNEKKDYSIEFRNYKEWKKTAGKNSSLKTYCVQFKIKYKEMVSWIKSNKSSR